MAALLKEVFQKEAHYYYREGAPKLDELDPTLEISYQTLLEDTSKYLWQVVDHFERLQEGSLYIHSDAQPSGDFDPNYQPFLDLLAEKHIEFVLPSLLRSRKTGRFRPHYCDDWSLNV